MDEHEDIPVLPEDELWDPDLQRRELLAMRPSERVELMAELCRQAAIFDQMVIRRP